MTKCHSCAHSYMEPSGDAILICGHPDAGAFGKYLLIEPADHCLEFIKFKQHPLRNADGTLKGASNR